MIRSLVLAAVMMLASSGLSFPAATVSPPNIELSQTLHFLSPGGEDVVVEAGVYEVSREDTHLILKPTAEGGATPKTIMALPVEHSTQLDTPASDTGPGEDGQYFIGLFFPDGSGLMASGTPSGIQPRGGPEVRDHRSGRTGSTKVPFPKFGQVGLIPPKPVPSSATVSSSTPTTPSAGSRPPGVKPPPGVVAPRPGETVTEKPPPSSSNLNCPTQRVKTVTTAEQLKVTLESDFTGTIFIPSGTSIELVEPKNIFDGITGITVMKPMRNLPIKACVQLKGTRGGLDPGALLFTDFKNTKEGTEEAVFQVIGHHVRIEGLRFRGPAPTYHDYDRSDTGGRVTAIGIWSDALHVEIDNNDFSFWNHAVGVAGHLGMSAGQANLIRVTRNYFHRNANGGNGYGVILGGGDGYVTIEGNLFTHNRHAIAASSDKAGKDKGGYIAKYNYVLEGGFTEGAGKYWNQHFDVHGQYGGYGGKAREYIEIAYNTIRGKQEYGALGFTETRPAFMLRGKPSIGAYFHDNVLVHDDESEAVRLKEYGLNPKTGEFGPTCGPSHAGCNLFVGSNSYNTDTSSDLAVGDFDGDGRDDVFLANGTGWWYSSAGLTEWRFLRASNVRIKELRFGRFDSDARTDVLFPAGDWYVSSGGQGVPKRVRGDGTRLTDCVFGDFNGDARTDALRANGTTWSVALGGEGSWIPKFNSPVTAANLRVSDFNGDRRDDVLFISGETSIGPIKTKQWSFWQYDSTMPTQINAILGNAITSFVVADFDGDGYADLAQTDGNGWRWLPNGIKTNSWTWKSLRGAGGQNKYKNIKEALLGRFTPGDKLLDALHPGKNFVIWRGSGTPDTFAQWTPPLQEMR